MAGAAFSSSDESRAAKKLDWGERGWGRGDSLEFGEERGRVGEGPVRS